MISLAFYSRALSGFGNGRREGGLVVAKETLSDPDRCAHLVGPYPARLKVTSLILGRDTSLGCRFGPSQSAQERQPIDASLPHQCFSPSVSKNK